jgi:hypothetical protein
MSDVCFQSSSSLVGSGGILQSHTPSLLEAGGVQSVVSFPAMLDVLNVTSFRHRRFEMKLDYC